MHCHVTCVIRVYIQVGTSLCGGRKCSPTLINGKKERKKSRHQVASLVHCATVKLVAQNAFITVFYFIF